MYNYISQLVKVKKKFFNSFWTKKVFFGSFALTRLCHSAVWCRIIFSTFGSFELSEFRHFGRSPIYFRFRLLARVISQEAESWHKHDRNRRKVKIRLLPTESARHWKQMNCIRGNCFTYVLSVIKIMLQYSSNAGCLLGSIIVSFFFN